MAILVYPLIKAPNNVVTRKLVRPPEMEGGMIAFQQCHSGLPLPDNKDAIVRRHLSSSL